MMSLPGARNRRPPGGGNNHYVGVPHQQQFMRPPAAMLPLSNPNPQPNPAHMIQNTQGQQGQQQRRALLQGPALMTHTQRPNASQMGGYTPQTHIYPAMMHPQPHAAAMGLTHFNPYQPQSQPQQIFSHLPPHVPPYPTGVSTVRAQHPHSKPRKAIPIVDPETKIKLDVSTITKGSSSNTTNVSITNDTTSTNTNTNTATSNEQSSIDENKRKMFKEQMQEISSNSTSISTEYRPNALISSPSTERHTNTSKGITIKSEGSLLPDPPHLTQSQQDTTTTRPLTADSKSFIPTETKLTHTNIKSVSSNDKPILSDTKLTPTETKLDTESTSDDTKSLPADTKSTTVDSADTKVESSVSKESESDIKSTVSDSPPVDLSSTQEETIKQVVPPITNTSDRQHPKAAGLLPTPPITSAINVSPKILEEIMLNSTLSTKMDSSSSSLSSSQTTTTTTVRDNDRTSIDKSPTGERDELSQEELSDDGNDDINDSDIPNGHISTKLDHNMFKDAQGRYVYKRDFLLQYSALPLQPPEDLKGFEILSFGAGQRSVDNMRKSPQQGYGRPGKNIKVIDHQPSRIEKVELRKAENRWKRSDGKTESEESETEKLFRKFQGILNKLTPQKFKDLAERARELEINTEERLKGCIDKIFSKALEEPNFSVAYAHLCRVLSFIKVEVVKVDDDGDETVRETTFRRELLTRCQKEFEKDKRDDEEREVKVKAIEEATTPEEKSLKEAQLNEWETKTRKRSLGNIRFIGELFKLKMLSESIMHECIVRLLRSTSDEDALECFSRLITTTGKELDHPQAKVRLDRYFERINEIIEKKKISSRIRFMLQDVQEMRKNDWVPRKQETLKTIDQIHHEAELEAMQEKEMLRAMQPVSGKQYGREGDRKKGGKDDYTSSSTSSSGGGGRKGDKSSATRRDSTPDVTRITALVSKKEKTAPSLGPGSSLRPGGGGWKPRSQGTSPVPSSSGSTTTVESKAPLKGPQRSSSSGTKRQNSSSGNSSSSSSKNSQQGSTKRSLTNPDEKSDALKAISDFLSAPPPAAGPSPTLVKKPIKDKLDEETIERKTATIVDELSQNGDYKEAIECVIELESPGLMHVFVRTGINHSLEKSTSVRVTVGKLFDQLVKEKQLTEDKLTQGLQEVLEYADDLEVDIPKIWNFFAELMAPLVCTDSLSLSVYSRLLKEANLGRKVAKNISRTLKESMRYTGREKVCQLWERSGMKWNELGLADDEIEEFLKDEDLTFLIQSSPVIGSTPAATTTSSSSSDISPPFNPPYLKDLTSLFGSQNSTTDDIIDWIEKQVSQEETRSPNFVKTLARAAVDGSSSGGDGASHIFNNDNFTKRLTLLKKWVDQDEKLQELVLEGVQVGVTQLKHPPNLIHRMLHLLYDVEVVSEKALLNWHKSEKEMFGRGVIMQSSKWFFNWLEMAETESDNETV